MNIKTTIAPGFIYTASLFIAIIVYSSSVLSCNSSNHRQPQKKNSFKQTDNIVVDQEGNRYPVKKMHDNIIWMTANLQLTIADSYCYDDLQRNCDRFGRLYTWTAAIKGCSQLGKGWRLPSRDEWQQLVAKYGLSKDSIDFRKIAYQTLLYPGNSTFSALLGGGRNINGQFARMDAHGFYWTASGNDSTAWYYNFAKGSQAIFLQDEGEKSRGFSVRCVCTIAINDK